MMEVGLNQSQLAKLVDLKQPSIGRLITGETRETGKLMELAKALDVSPEYLTGDDDHAARTSVADPRRSFRHASPVTDDTVELHELDLRLGMGATYFDVPVKAEMRRFSRAWLRHFSDTSPKELVFAHSIGDSMMPTILDNDLLLIDVSQRSLNIQDKIWAAAYGEVGMIKRLNARPNGSIQILSDNALVPTDTAYDGELHILGRVVGIFRKA